MTVLSDERERRLVEERPVPLDRCSLALLVTALAAAIWALLS